MALTQTAEYALRAVVWLAQHPGQMQTTQQIAEATQVPSSYLPKVFQPLVRSGLVVGRRGLRGGYELRRDPAEVTLLEVVQCVDPIHRIESCPLSLSTHKGRLCPLHHLLNQIILAEEKQLGEARIGDLLGRPGQLEPLCETSARIEEARARKAPKAPKAPEAPEAPGPNPPHPSDDDVAP